MERMHEGGCVVVDDTADTVRESVFDQASPDLSNVLCIPDFPRVDFREVPLETIECEDCDGRGIDAGSLYEPEFCPVCQGTGRLFIEEPQSTAEASTPGPDILAVGDWLRLPFLGHQFVPRSGHILISVRERVLVDLCRGVGVPVAEALRYVRDRARRGKQCRGVRVA